MTKIIISLLLLTFTPAIALAQDGRQLLERIEQAVQEKEPDWSVTQRSAHETTMLISFVYNKAPAGVDAPIVLITAEITKSIEKAKSRFKVASRTAASVARREKGKKIELNDLGEEAFSYPGIISPGSVGITFRSGKIMIYIVKGPEAAARRFADLIAARLAAP